MELTVAKKGASHIRFNEVLPPQGDLLPRQFVDRIRSSCVRQLDAQEERITSAEYARYQEAEKKLKLFNEEASSASALLGPVGSGVGVGMLVGGLGGAAIGWFVGTTAGAAHLVVSETAVDEERQELCQNIGVVVVNLAQVRVRRAFSTIGKLDDEIARLERENIRLKREMGSLWPSKTNHPKTLDELEQDLAAIVSKFKDALVFHENGTITGPLKSYMRLKEMQKEAADCRERRIEQRLAFLEANAYFCQDMRVMKEICSQAKSHPNLVGHIGQALRELGKALTHDVETLRLDSEGKLPALKGALSFDKLDGILKPTVYPEKLLQRLEEKAKAGRIAINTSFETTRVMLSQIELGEGRRQELAGRLDKLEQDLRSTFDRFLQIIGRIRSRKPDDVLASVTWKCTTWLANRVLPQRWQFVNVESALQELEGRCQSLEEAYRGLLSECITKDPTASGLPALRRGITKLRGLEENYLEGIGYMRPLLPLMESLARFEGVFRQLMSNDFDARLLHIKQALREEHPTIVAKHPWSKGLKANLLDIEELMTVREGLRDVHTKYRKRFEQVARFGSTWDIGGHKFRVQCDAGGIGLDLIPIKRGSSRQLLER